jgi:F-type H+-transporting ATPase subunit b
MLHYLADASQQDPLVPTWPELIIGLICFIGVFGIFGKMFIPRIGKTLQERTDKIDGGLARAAEAQDEANKALKQYQDQLAEARHEAARLREEAKEQGAQIIAEMRKQAQEEAKRITDAAQAQIEAERQQALIALRQQVGTLATELAGKIVGESLTDEARQGRMVDRFLDDLEGANARR